MQLLRSESEGEGDAGISGSRGRGSDDQSEVPFSGGACARARGLPSVGCHCGYSISVMTHKFDIGLHNINIYS
jgi:hypothetical protein